MQYVQRLEIDQNFFHKIEGVIIYEEGVKVRVGSFRGMSLVWVRSHFAQQIEILSTLICLTFFLIDQQKVTKHQHPQAMPKAKLKEKKQLKVSTSSITLRTTSICGQ